MSIELSPQEVFEEIGEMKVRVEGYHKRTGDVEAKLEKNSERFGARLGSLEMIGAVMEHRVMALEKCIEEIKKSISSVTIKISGAVGLILMGFELVDRYWKK